MSSAKSNRDNFSASVKNILAHRAGYRCSKPDCRALTAGPSNESIDALTNIGVASHITAAAQGGARFDPALTPEDRGSGKNGIWLCQTHAKEIDDDNIRFTADVLRAWKRDAEEEARDLLGKPISGQSIDASIRVSCHRDDNGTLTIAGSTNLPNGTKLFVELYKSRTNDLLGQSKIITNDGMFMASGFSTIDAPHPHGWYKVRVMAYFNDPWEQPQSVLAIVGPKGKNLVGKYAEPLHPEFLESEIHFSAVFECIAPPLKAESKRSSIELERAIALVKGVSLVVDGDRSALPIGDTVQSFMKFPGLSEHMGWSAKALANGAIVVSYSYWNGDESVTAEWIAILDTQEVRYQNLYGKYMSWSPSY